MACSLSASTSAASADPPAESNVLQYVRWTDPREYAFSLDVPQGWQIHGGMFRTGPLDTRPAIDMISPDNQIRVTAGDASIPTFTEPNPMFMMAGLTEGSWYSPGYGTQMMVWRYLPESTRQAEEAPEDEAQDAGRAETKPMWRDRRVIPFLVYGFVVATCQTAQQQTLGFLIIDKLGVSPLAAQHPTAIAT